MDHKLRTRRDFLAHGLISFSAMSALPTFLGLGIRQTFGAECGADPEGKPFTPFLVFDMAGGAALPANFLVGRQGGAEDLLASYSLLGWDPREAGALNTQFGLPMSAKYSGLLKGLLANTSEASRANFRMGSFCHFAQDDTSSNQLNAASLVLSSGSQGKYVTNGMGLIGSNSGGNSASVVSSTILKPTAVGSVTDVLGAVSFGGPGFAGMAPKFIKSLAKGGIDLSGLQKKRYFGIPGGDKLAELSKCAYQKSQDFTGNLTALDPRTDETVRAVYGLQANGSANDANTVAAALAMNTIKGNAGPSVWTLGGCDYHDGTQTTGDRKDEEMGVQIGRAIELAHRLKRPLFFQLLTDGGCSADAGSRKWRGDDGGKCMTVLGYYNPNGAPKMMRTQVGHFTQGQGAERATLLGSQPLLVGYAVLANFLNIHGRLGEFHTYAPGIFTKKEDLESVLLFEA